MPKHPCLLTSAATSHVYCRIARSEVVFDDHHGAIEIVERLREVRNLERCNRIDAPAA